MKDILIVEDGAPERARLEKLFTEVGYLVQACATVGEAEKCVQSEGFRIAILDIGLSDKSGSYLFNMIRRAGRVSYIMIFTGNPSVHLKQRFLDEGAVDYIVKGSPQAQNEQLLGRIRELIGIAQSPEVVPNGIPLDQFLSSYVNEKSRALFMDANNAYPTCSSCGASKFVVVFSHVPQVPPEVRGTVRCSACGKELDEAVG